MNAINRNGFALGLTGTIIIWILAIILGFFIKIESPVKDYTEIRISLSDPSPVRELPKAKEDNPLLPPKEKPAAETVQELPALEEPAAPVKEIQTEKPAPVETPKPVEQPKPAAPVKKAETAKPAEKAPAPVKETPKTTPSTAQIVKSVEELAREQASKKKKAVFDESLFADEADFTESTSQKPAPVTQKATSSSSSSFEGTAASGSEAKSSDTSQTSSSTAKKTGTQTDSGTRDSLDKLKDTVAVGGSRKTSEEKTSVTGEGGGVKSGSVDIKWAEGKSRKLLYPAKPVIKIPARLQTLIDSTKKVQIRFTVLASGNVTMTDINITPSAVLPLEVQNEIKKQISTWLFDEDVSDGQAVFDYSIIKE